MTLGFAIGACLGALLAGLTELALGNTAEARFWFGGAFGAGFVAIGWVIV